MRISDWSSDVCSSDLAIVTGGGMGIGKEVARFLSQEGCKVVICARRMEYLQQAAEEISAQTGNEVLPLFCDTNQMSAVSDMVEAAHKHFGRLDILDRKSTRLNSSH